MKFGMNKKNLFLVTAIMVFALSVVSVTYAYFALTVSNNVATATVGDANLVLSVTKKNPTSSSASSHMVPQKESGLSKAVSTTYNCVDSNNNKQEVVYVVRVIDDEAPKYQVSGNEVEDKVEIEKVYDDAFKNEIKKYSGKDVSQILPVF